MHHRYRVRGPGAAIGSGEASCSHDAQAGGTLSGLPTADEVGVPGYDVQVWLGLFAPAGTPHEVRRTIEAAVKQVLSQPDIRNKLEAVGMEVRSGSADELREVLAADIPKWATLVKDKKLQIAQ